jgi:hypothetical protein
MVVQKATFLLLFLILTLRRAVQFSNELVIMSQQQKRISITPCITSLFIYFVCSSVILNFLTVEEKKEIALWWGKMLSRTFFYYMRKSILDIVPVFPSSSESRLQLPHTHGNQTIIISKKYLTQLSYWLTIISK